MTRAELQDPVKRRAYFREYVRRRKASDPNYRKELAANTRRYRARNPKKIEAYRAAYRKSGRWAAYMRRYRSGNPSVRLANSLRVRLVSALRRNQGLRPGRKPASILKLLGCSLMQLRDHLESQFREGMGWGNYGQWHIDHIIPCVSFDLSDMEQAGRCFNFSNLQPLWASENCRKRAN